MDDRTLFITAWSFFASSRSYSSSFSMALDALHSVS
jgi:hypothetical protein